MPGRHVLFPALSHSPGLPSESVDRERRRSRVCVWIARPPARLVTTSICAVSRASFFTGLYARSHGIHGFATSLSEEQHAYSYPVRLREEAGYRTGFIGKYGVGRDTPDDRFGFPGRLTSRRQRPGDIKL